MEIARYGTNKITGFFLQNNIAYKKPTLIPVIKNLFSKHIKNKKTKEEYKKETIFFFIIFVL